ncbi:hypothetical protein BKA82DRAFT_1002513 [Pisolithus tinctorius]|uniref:Rhodopsin domain-containing protein n=1 Tax=Pisolithus tinctorius Marx 270 TaxID=870435 RepID=A0A0C3JXE5_PISTI|nr:hypothetical protein BKA82DRAFT_1002513 [Pisolithus tinctorius]KIO02077.1 hypothetical protein M404DRAFT_1002513 [Pisolithus tinctorius Marx 270]
MSGVDVLDTHCETSSGSCYSIRDRKVSLPPRLYLSQATMSSSGPTIQQTEVVGIVLPVIATVVTSFRLFLRIRQHRLWLDDAWAALAMVLNVVYMVVGSLYLDDYARYPQDTRVALYYMVAQIFCTIVWLSRISILFTVVRLTFPGSLRRLLVRTAIAFVVTWMILFAQVFWTCEAEPGWKSQPRPQCDLGRNVAIAQIITDVIGDTILILAPFRLIYKVRLNKAQKIRLLSIFSASAVTTVVSLTHAYYVLSDGGLSQSAAAIVESSVGLVVANLSVVVAFLFRISTEETTAPAPLELKSIITFGSQPIRKRTPRNPLSMSATVVAIETQTIKVDDSSPSPKQAAGRDSDDAETASLETLAQPGHFRETQ